MPDTQSSSAESLQSGTSGTANASPVAAYAPYLVPEEVVQEGLYNLSEDRYSFSSLVQDPTTSSRSVFVFHELSPQSQQVLKQRGDQLVQDARRYFARHSTPPRALPAIDYPARVPDTLRTLLSHMDGVVLGEQHDSLSPILLLISQFPQLYEQGVRTLYLEKFNVEENQPALDEYNRDPNPDASLPSVLLEHLALYKGRWWDLALLKSAHSHGMNIVALESLAQDFEQYTPARYQSDYYARRTAMFNYFAKLVIDHHQNQPRAGKWIALVGSAHANNHMGSPGLAELTNTVGISVAEHPSPVGAYCTIDAGKPGAVAPIKCDLRILYRMGPDEPGALNFNTSPTVELEDVAKVLNDSSESNPYVIRALPSEQTYELYYRNKDGKIVSAPIEHRQQDGLDSFTVRSPDGFVQGGMPFNSLAALRKALRKRLFDVWSDLTPRFTPPESWPVANNLPESLTLPKRFTQDVKSALAQIAWTETPENRNRFKQGKAAVKEARSEKLAAWFPGLTLAHSSDRVIATLWAQAGESLSWEQKGALLEQLDRNRAQRSKKLSETWKDAMKVLGAEEENIQLLSQNRYMVAFDDARGEGFCRAFSAQVMAQSLQAAPNAITEYMNNFQGLLEAPGSDAAKLFELGILEWTFNSDNSRFQQHRPQAAGNPRKMIDILSKGPIPAAYELRAGRHALGLCVTGSSDAPRYALFDPNFGFAQAKESTNVGKLESDAIFHKMLELHLKLLWEQALIPVGCSFELQRYRADLPQQALLPDIPLTLADLGHPEYLAQSIENQQAYQRQEQRLRRTELSVQWRREQVKNDLGEPLTQLLLTLLKRAGVPSTYRDARAWDRLSGIRFKGDSAWIILRTERVLGLKWKFESFELEGVDGIRRKELALFSALLEERESRPSGLFSACMRSTAQEALDLRQLAMTAALAEDEASCAHLLARLTQAGCVCGKRE